jgi:phosphonopyruvate decarboxylase
VLTETLPTTAAAIAETMSVLTPDVLVVAANGYVSRLCHQARHRPGTFYMLGSMGLASSIARGLSLAEPGRPVLALDGDGNALMGLAAFAIVGALPPTAFLHAIVDNGRYASTGGQPTLSATVDWPVLARAAGYRRAERVERLDAIGPAVRRLLSEPGPALLHLPVRDGAGTAPRVPLRPREIAANLRAALGRSDGAA